MYVNLIRPQELTAHKLQSTVWSGNITIGGQQFRIDFDTGSAVSLRTAGRTPTANRRVPAGSMGPERQLHKPGMPLKSSIRRQEVDDWKVCLRQFI